MRNDQDYGSFNIAGLGPDAKIVKTEEGGLQSENPYSFESLPPLALARVAKVLAQGQRKYGRFNWTNIIDPLDHAGKAIGHIMAFNAGDTQEGEPDEHLAHALCRLLFALDIIERNKQKQVEDIGFVFSKEEVEVIRHFIATSNSQFTLVELAREQDMDPNKVLNFTKKLFEIENEEDKEKIEERNK